MVPHPGPAVGVDVGLKSFLVTSDEGLESETVERLEPLKRVLPELRRLQRAVARKKKGGSNRRKAVGRVARLHARVANVRREFHHQEALKLVRKYGTIVVEKLNIQGMMKNRRLARSISDAAWGSFLLILRSKAETAGSRFVEVNPWGTSQQCSGCGTDVPKDLSIRTHMCPSCGLSINRDENAARNILVRAMGILGAGDTAVPKCGKVGIDKRSRKKTKVSDS